MGEDRTCSWSSLGVLHPASHSQPSRYGFQDARSESESEWFIECERPLALVNCGGKHCRATFHHCKPSQVQPLSRQKQKTVLRTPKASCWKVTWKVASRNWRRLFSEASSSDSYMPDVRDTGSDRQQAKTEVHKQRGDNENHKNQNRLRNSHLTCKWIQGT